MKILAASVASAAGTFLHAGYISAAAETTQGASFGCNEAVRAGAATLDAASVASAGALDSLNGGVDAVAASGGHDWFVLLAGVVFFVGALAVTYLFRQWRSDLHAVPD